MKALFAVLAISVTLMAGGLYYQFFYPPSVMKNNTEAALSRFADAVETQDRAKVSEALQTLLADDAKIRLEVTFSAISSANVRPMTQDFDKAQFIAFLDHILYPMRDYHDRPTLQRFALGEDQVAAVEWNSSQSGVGPSYYSGVALEMQYSGSADCRGEAIFDQARQPQLKTAACSVLLRSVAKTDSSAGVLDQARQIRRAIDGQPALPLP